MKVKKSISIKIVHVFMEFVHVMCLKYNKFEFGIRSNLKSSAGPDGIFMS